MVSAEARGRRCRYPRWRRENPRRPRRAEGELRGELVAAHAMDMRSVSGSA
ncbi:MAG: hypothetical protein M5R42_01495 [Rhodocyclaceae bacterium]|nr:hypothetical protein [Rhodocyclaceae bacterium]